MENQPLTIGEKAVLALYIVFDATFLYYMAAHFPLLSFFTLFFFSPVFFIAIVLFFSALSRTANLIEKTTMALYKCIICIGWIWLFEGSSSSAVELLNAILTNTSQSHPLSDSLSSLHFSGMQYTYIAVFTFWIGLSIILALTSIVIQFSSLILNHRVLGFRNLRIPMSLFVFVILGFFIYELTLRM